jgi:hypothetical protein
VGTKTRTTFRGALFTATSEGMWNCFPNDVQWASRRLVFDLAARRVTTRRSRSARSLLLGGCTAAAAAAGAAKS